MTPSAPEATPGLAGELTGHRARCSSTGWSPGTDDDGNGNGSPQYGMNMWGTITYMSLTNALLHGVTAGVLDNTGRGSVISYHAVATRTGTIAAPSAIARLADTERD